MKAFILLCDAARAHADGTFSLLRGGITRVQAPAGKPIQFRGSMVVRLFGTLGEASQHDVRIQVLDEDGKSVAPDITGKFQVPQGGGGGQVVADFALTFPAYGRYTFTVSVDRHELDTWSIDAVEAQPPPGQTRV